MTKSPAQLLFPNAPISASHQLPFWQKGYVPNKKRHARAFEASGILRRYLGSPTDATIDLFDPASGKFLVARFSEFFPKGYRCLPVEHNFTAPPLESTDIANE